MSKQHRPTYTREDGTEMFVLPKGFFKDVAAAVRASGEKPSKGLLAMEEELPLEFTREEFEYLWRHLEMKILMEAMPEERHELLRDYDTCPCCDRWMGHNRPPTDEPPANNPPFRRQSSFDFNR